MALRTTCLCNGKIIGIESIYTVVDGMQINIPDKVEALRALSKNKELFCPCGCGANLTLVAGDRNLREQHFRLRDPQHEKECEYISEGLISVNSKIVLKCWLEDKLHGSTIESRIPICAIEDTSRRYEMTLLSKEQHIAISYCHDRANLSDEKIEILENNTSGIRVFYITDIENDGTDAQYPEMMMKIQKRQGFCLYLQLSIDEKLQPKYVDAELKISFFYHNPNGYWQEVEVLRDSLSSFSFGYEGTLFHSEKTVLSLKQQKEKEFLDEIERRRLEWEKQQEALKAENKRRRQEEEKRVAEYQARQAQIAEQARIQREKQERLRREEQERKAAEAAALEKAKRDFTREKIDAIIDDDQETPFRDPFGNRWVRCEYCGKLDTEGAFVSYGGYHHVNLGTCKVCSNEKRSIVLPKYAKRIQTISHPTEKPNWQTTCPECGGQLKERSGRFGSFWGCSNYPTCRYTRKK